MSSIVLEEYELLGDAKYRSYMSQVDKALKGFEYTTEWPDLIAALGKLNKVLLAHMKYPIIPRRIVISKRLAQCMHHALPSGVHLKALDTYDIIFKCMGTNRLAQELFLYSAGLFPLLGNAAMNVRTVLLTVYETHFVPLGERLRPALNGLLSGVLPGLEEGSDHYERTKHLLESICDSCSSPTVFYSALWECVASNQSIRLPAVSFILQHFDRKQSVEEQQFLFGDKDIVVHALSFAVQDSSVLVQRCTLDLLIMAFPLHSNFLEDSEIIEILTSATTVLLRRDTSLNRRFFNWLLGFDTSAAAAVAQPPIVYHPPPDVVPGRSLSVSSYDSGSEAEKNVYFEHYARNYFVDALRQVLARSVEADTEEVDLKPYRLLVTLLDKVEVGPVIIDDVIIDVIRTLYHVYKAHPPKPQVGKVAKEVKGQTELIKTANLFFSALESSYIWDFCGATFEQTSCNKYRINDSYSSDVNHVGCEETTVIEMCALIDFLLDIVSIETYVETFSEHLPELFKRILGVLTKKCANLTAMEIAKTLKLCRKILSKVQPSWNAWDAQLAKMSPAKHSISIHSGDKGSIHQQEKAAQNMWNSIGKSIHFGNGDSPPVLPAVKSDESKSSNSSPEVGREATESLPMSLPVSPIHEIFDSDDVTEVADDDDDYDVHKAHEALMEDCITAYQTFFVEFMRSRIFSESVQPHKYMEHMTRWPNDTMEERTRHLERLLAERIGAESASTVRWPSDHDLEEESLIQELKTLEVSLREDVEGFLEGIKSSFQILVDLSSIPTVGEGRRVKPSYECSPAQVPEWLQYLLLCSCLLGYEHSEFQLNSINTLLEIIALLQSVMSVEQANGGSNESNCVIVMMPLIKEQHFACIVKQTLVAQVIAAKLWDGLSSMVPIFHLRCSTLLHQLHNIVPNSQSIEKIVTRSLGYGHLAAESNNIVEAFQRFTLFWHLSRDLDMKRHNGRQVKTFDVCLLKMLDNLNLSSGPLKTLCQSWIVHSMARGDISRIVEPLFLTLLDPTTARVSVLHARIEHTSLYSDQPDDGESGYGEHIQRIFAISSVDGEVIYHVSEPSNERVRRNRNTDRARKLFALNTFNEASKTRRSFRVPSTRDFEPKAPQLQSLPPLINPFALVPPDIEDYDSFTKGYRTADSSTTSSTYSLHSTSRNSLAGPQIAHEVINDVLEAMFDNIDTASPMDSLDAETGDRNLTIHPLHSHLLLYTQVCDSKQILYTLQCIKNILQTNPRLTICTLATTSLSSVQSPRCNQLQMLLARHRKSVFGKGFTGDLNSENMTTYRSSTLIEVLISTSLYYLRSYYPNLGQVRLSDEEIQSNREVQLMSIDIITLLVSELITVVKDNGKAFATYIYDLLTRCKVQKVVLHSLLAGVHEIKEVGEGFDFTDDILGFNEVYAGRKEQGKAHCEKISNYSEAFQVHVLRLLLSLIMLEQVLMQQKQEGDDMKTFVASASKQQTQSPQPQQAHVLRYIPDHVIPDQPMFLASIVSALRQDKMRHLHPHWTSLVTSCLPFLGRSMTPIVMEVSTQLGKNLEKMAAFYTATKDSFDLGQIPVDYVVTQLEALTLVYHYCLLDSAPQVSVHSGSAMSGTASALTSSSASNADILSNLLHVFLTTTDVQNIVHSSSASGQAEAIAVSRKSLLSTLPRLLVCVSTLWSALESIHKPSESSAVLVGAPRSVKNRILDLLSPISHHHPVSFLSAIAVAWHEKRSAASAKRALPTCNADQQVLVDLLGAIRTMPVATVIQTVRQVLKNPPVVSGSHKVNLEVSCLQFFYSYLAKCSSVQVFESWSGLSTLLKDCLVLAPPAIFLALAILNQFVQRAPNLQKKDHRELQDLAGKLIEACAQIGGSCLEQTTWLKRNLAVKEELQQGMKEVDIVEAKIDDEDETKSITQFTVPALSLLGELLASLLDIIYQSDEKEKVVPLLHNVMYNVVPYLRNHSPANMTSFRACSKLLANLSEYQYTRKAWKREGMELLVDPAFFQIDLESLRHWETIVDNLMTHDKTTFKDLMTKVASISQSGSLSLFSSKEQELEQRALLLKRLAFVIFCSEIDQYQKQMPDIQERLAESLRTIPSSPSVQSAVFLCFRVILVRMSPHHVTSLWPLIITEMVQIFSYLEQELSTDTEEWSSHLRQMSTLDSSWVMSAGSNGLAAHNSPAWLDLFLGVCKLLDLALALPAQKLPQFQMYRWAFVSEGHGTANGPVVANGAAHANILQQPDFVPYVVRVAKLLLQKVDDVTPLQLIEGQPQLTMTSILSLEDLAPFFASICDSVTRQQTKAKGVKEAPAVSGEPERSEFIDGLMEKDFIEAIAK